MKSFREFQFESRVSKLKSALLRHADELRDLKLGHKDRKAADVIISRIKKEVRLTDSEFYKVLEAALEISDNVDRHLLSYGFAAANDGGHGRHIYRNDEVDLKISEAY